MTTPPLQLPKPDTRPQPSPHYSEDSASTKQRKGFRNPLSRSKSIRRDSHSKSKPSIKQSFEQPPKTAPIASDWQNSSELLLKAKKDKRGKSAERAVTSGSEENLPPENMKSQREKIQGQLMTGGKSIMSKTKSGGGNLLNRLGKIGRSHSNTEKEVPDSEYVLKVINLPLVEQTRVTRISKNLEQCKDKTEYWMPSLPWRCIECVLQQDSFFEPH